MTISMKFFRDKKDVFVDTVNNRIVKKDVFCVVENESWVVRHEWENVLRNIPQLRSHVTSVPYGIRDAIVHFGSHFAFFRSDKLRKAHPDNKVVVTWFHVEPGDPRVRLIPEADKIVDLWHTSCSFTAKELSAFGIPEKKIVIVPLGSNALAFSPAKSGEKESLRKDLGIPDGHVVIGSFQKDGNGWAEGNTPKLIKGPDIFCDVVERIAKDRKVFVLLSGPARGYVKNRLKAAGIPFVHKYKEDPEDVAQFFKALDLYIVGSRVEGGPKALWESMASGVPLVTTKVGMAADWVVDGKNALMADVGDVEALVEKSLLLLEDRGLRENIVREASVFVKRFDWSNVAQSYYEKVYRPLMVR